MFGLKIKIVGRHHGNHPFKRLVHQNRCVANEAVRKISSRSKISVDQNSLAAIDIAKVSISLLDNSLCHDVRD